MTLAGRPPGAATGSRRHGEEVRWPGRAARLSRLGPLAAIRLHEEPAFVARRIPHPPRPARGSRRPSAVGAADHPDHLEVDAGEPPQLPGNERPGEEGPAG